MSEYPKWKYHKKLEAVIVENREEEDFLDKEFPTEWKNTVADFGVITHPSADQSLEVSHGFSFAQLKEKLLNEKAAALIASKKG